MKTDECAICGRPAHVVHADAKGGALYGVRCDGGHDFPCVFGTKNRAVQAWNECQGFVLRYTEEEA